MLLPAGICVVFSPPSPLLHPLFTLRYYPGRMSNDQKLRCKGGSEGAWSVGTKQELISPHNLHQSGSEGGMDGWLRCIAKGAKDALERQLARK